MLKPLQLLRNYGILFSLLFISFSAQAKNYYFSSQSGNDSYNSSQAQNESTPWKSIEKLNSFFGNIAAGDNIYFKRGEIFYGSIIFSRSGTSNNLITIGAYGTGDKPIITGLVTLSSWSQVSPGVYQASAPAVKASVNLVSLNGKPQQVGRYPNADAANKGYLIYESFSPRSITDNQLTTSTNWAGAEVVIRKQHYALEKCLVTAHTGGTLNYQATAVINPMNSATAGFASGTSGYGYFIQRDVRTLDQLGEWYFNDNSKSMLMYFGANNPSSYNIKVSTIDTLVNLNSQYYININNISFEGGNFSAIFGSNSGYITIDNCDINLMGAKGIMIFNSPNILIKNVTTNNVLSNAIDLTSRYQNNASVINCTIKNTGTIAGMGSFWDDTDYKALYVSVNSTALIQFNNIDTTGYVGIQFQGNDILVKNNYVNYYDYVKDDGGGIYTYQDGTDADPQTTYTNREISNNIILNGIGSPSGTGGDLDVDGIFLDGRSMNVNVLNNTMANIGVNGIYSNNAHSVNIRGNTSFNNGSGFGITRYSWGSTVNLSIKQNIFYPKYNTQDNFEYVNTGVNVPVVSTIQSVMQQIGDIDSNYYSLPNATGFSYRYTQYESGAWTFSKPLSFEGWKSITSHDRVSKIPPRFASYKLNSLLTANSTLNGQFTNDISGTTVWCSNANIVSSWDNTSKITGTGSLKITPASSSTEFTLLYGTVGAVSTSKQYILRFNLIGSSASGVVRAYIRKTASPRTTLTPVQVANFGKSVTKNEFLFTAPTTDADASFTIEIQQASGTTYVDDIEFYEADATVLDIDSQLRFEYNATNAPKTIALDAKYIGTDSAIYNGTVTMQPYTSKILVKYGPSTAPIPPSSTTLSAVASVANISCFNGTTDINITGTGGTAPYTGTGINTINAGTGSLKISVPSPAARASTLLYSTVGAVSSDKTYILRFSTLGTTPNGSLKVYLRQTTFPYATITPVQTTTYSNTRLDHEFMFTAPTSQAAASFLIDMAQSSGTTYIDNIAFFEATSNGILISDNLYSSGQFENSIAGITVWSESNNHIAALDNTSKITNTYYYPVQDATGAIATATAKTTQPAVALVASSTAGSTATTGGTTTIVVSASGGTAPYTGTGSFSSIKAGNYSYTVSDAKGCKSVTFVTVKQASAARVATNASIIDPTTSRITTTNELLQNSAFKITVFPNPTVNSFTLNVTGGTFEVVNILVSSIDGKILYQTKGNTNTNYSFGNGFLSGIYIVKVIQGNSSEILKVIKL